MKKSFKLFIGALVLTFFVSQNLFAESRCQTFFKEMLTQDISSDVFNPAITPVQSIGFGKKKYFDKNINDFEFYKNKEGYFVVGRIDKKELIGKVKKDDVILKVNDIDIRKFDFRYLVSEEDEKNKNFTYLEEMFQNGEDINVLLKDPNTNETFKVKTKKQELELNDYAIDLFIEHIKLNEKNGTLDLTFSKEYLFIALGENFKITNIAKETLFNENTKEYEYCPFTVAQWKKLDTLDPNLGMKIENIVSRDKSLIQESYEILPRYYEENNQHELDIGFKSFGTTTLRNDYDLKSFPFDKQKIRILIHQENYFLDTVYLEETKYAHRDLEYFANLDKIQGWDIVNFEINQYLHNNPNYSQPFDGIEIVLDIERESAYYIFKIILPIILILVVCWSSIWITPREIESRLTITIVCLLSLIAYNFVIDSELPKLEYLTTMDFIILMSYVYAAIPNFLSIYSHRRFLAKNKAKIKDLELYGRRYGFISYLSIVVIIIIINTNMSPDNTKAFLSWMALAQ